MKLLFIIVSFLFSFSASANFFPIYPFHPFGEPPIPSAEEGYQPHFECNKKSMLEDAENYIEANVIYPSIGLAIDPLAHFFEFYNPFYEREPDDIYYKGYRTYLKKCDNLEELKDDIYSFFYVIVRELDREGLKKIIALDGIDINYEFPVYYELLGYITEDDTSTFLAISVLESIRLFNILKKEKAISKKTRAISKQTRARSEKTRARLKKRRKDLYSFIKFLLENGADSSKKVSDFYELSIDEKNPYTILEIASKPHYDKKLRKLLKSYLEK